MIHHAETELAPPAERLAILANLAELALYAPESEITVDGRAALRRVAREIVVLTGVVAASASSSGNG